MEAPIEFSVQLTEKDVAAAQEQLWFRWRSFLVPGLILCVAGIAWMFDRPGGLPVVLATVGAICIYLATFTRWLFQSFARRDFRKNPAARVVNRYRLLDDRFIATSELGQSEVRWEALVKVKEGPDYLGLFLSPKLVFIIPLDQLTDAQKAGLRARSGAECRRK